MLSTKNIAVTLNDVPSTWVFEHYLKLEEKLTGQRVVIPSIFNHEKTPSMHIYLNKLNGEYFFKDFSSGKYGDKINLVQYMYQISLADASSLLIKDFNKYSDYEINKPTEQIFKEDTYEIIDFKIRDFQLHDSDYWTSFNITKPILDRFLVKALDYIIILKSGKEFKISNLYMYGYFDDKENIKKVYQPFNSKRKFFTVDNYIQGIEQLEYKTDYLVISSSLKDCMSLTSLNIKLETIAPGSENTILKPHLIFYFLKKYKGVFTVFDNDAAGKKAINRYRELYDVKGFSIPLSKDLSDSVKDHGPIIVRNNFIKLFKNEIK